MVNDITDVEKRTRPKKKEQTPDTYLAPDGRRRNKKFERELNEAFAIVFKGAAAQRVLEYLESISIRTVLERGSEPHEITYQEGARWLMGIIEQRIQLGEEKKP